MSATPNNTQAQPRQGYQEQQTSQVCGSFLRKKHRKTHRVALDELDTFIELVDEAMDAMNDTRIELEKTQEKLYELYDFCGEVPFDDSCDY